MLRPKLNRLWASANANLRRDPGDAKYLQGWISEIPTYQVLNFLQYKIDTTLLALAERGFFEWGSDVQYGLGSVVWNEIDKKIYVSTVGSPDKTKAPSANLSQWTASSIQIPRADYDTAVAAINAHIADVTGNPHQLTAGRLNAYNKNETDAIFAQYRAIVAAHANDKNNPHGVTAVQVGAVPVTGGTYTGDVTFNAGVFFDSGKVNKISKTGGLYLQTGNVYMGIRNDGKGVINNGSTESVIVTEETFPQLKADRESLFASPDPSFEMDLIGNINIRRGNGVTKSFGNTQPTYAPEYGNAYSQTANANASVGVSTQADGAGTWQTCTIAYDILSTTPRVTDDAQTAFYLGFSIPNNAIYILLRGSSNIIAERAYNDGSGTKYDGAGYQLTGPINTWYRLVATFDGPTIKLYLNGTLVATNTAATNTVDAKPNVAFLQINSRPAGRQRNWTCRNFRAWDEILTPEQISAL